jgi:hypothetical protein
MKYLAKLIVFIAIAICGVIVTLLSNLYFIFIHNLLWRLNLPTSMEIKQWNEYEDSDCFNERRSIFYKNFLFMLFQYKPYYKSYKWNRL